MLDVKVVVFDLDNTLIDRDQAVKDWLGTLMAPLQVRSCIAKDAGGYGNRAEFFSEVAEAALLAVDQARARFRAEIPGYIRPLQGAQEVLDRLTPGKRLAIATNGDGAMQRAKLAASRLVAPFDHVAISGEIGIAKPSGEFFLRVLAAMSCEPQQALMVGDHPVNDIEGAHNVGMRTCWLRTAHFPVPQHADRVIDHLGQMPWL